MSVFDYTASKDMAYRLVEKFGGECKIITKQKTKTAKCVFMSNLKVDKADGPTINTQKQLYVVGIDLDISTNDRVSIKNVQFLITNVELYNFDNQTKILYVLTVAK